MSPTVLFAVAAFFWLLLAIGLGHGIARWFRIQRYYDKKGGDNHDA